MDSIFSKFGLYDFMGIWGPGAIFVTYFSFTLHQPIHDFLWYCGITNPGFSSTHLLILLYTAAAYAVGVTLHELGRRIADVCNLFHANQIVEKSQSETDNESEPNKIQIFKRIRWNYKESIKKTISGEIYGDMSFDKAISYIKYNTSKYSSRIDTYHSIYALARSLSLTFILHSIIALFALCFKYNISPFYFASDIVFTFLFIVRAYRYHYFWVESVIMQYFYSAHLG